MLNFDLQNHRPLREIVYEELKRQILVGEIAPGTRMMEVDLADEMGVSRTPVREAIRKLEKEGLVQLNQEEELMHLTFPSRICWMFWKFAKHLKEWRLPLLQERLLKKKRETLSEQARHIMMQ